MTDPMHISLHTTRLHITEAQFSIVAAQHTSGATRAYHLAQARRDLAWALVPEAPLTDAVEWLVDTIATAIIDSTDIDCTAESQARYIVDELFKRLQPEQQKAEAAE